MKGSPVLRQRLRKALLLVMFLLFPIIMNYLSPYVIIDGASQGIVNGSLVVFIAMFLSALIVGRFWCGWFCPVGGILEMSFPINPQPVKNIRQLDWIKWVIWGGWMGVIVWMVIQTGGYHAINLALDTEGGISVSGSPDRPIFIAYIIYYFVLGLMIIPSLVIGKRATCHAVCWMAPFMILGRKLRNTVAWPALRLAANPAACTNCKTCTRNCPMSLRVNEMVERNMMEHSECILCGSCADGCPTKAIQLVFKSGK